MERFDDKGMLVFPNPNGTSTRSKEKIVVLQEVYCPNGHNLISSRATFNKFHGVMLKVKSKKTGRVGSVALSPILGDKTRVSLDLDLESGEVLEVHCPTCDATIPVFSQCSCGADLIALFTTKKNDFADIMGICSRVDCHNFEIQSGGKLIEKSTLEALGWD